MDSISFSWLFEFIFIKLFDAAHVFRKARDLDDHLPRPRDRLRCNSDRNV